MNFGPLSPYTGIPRESIRPTLAHLKLCQRARSQGYPVSYANDPRWLVNMAINRRACWPDDPSECRGSAMPVKGEYPKRARGSEYMRVWRLSRAAGRVIVRDREASILHERHRAKIRTWSADDLS